MFFLFSATTTTTTSVGRIITYNINLKLYFNTIIIMNATKAFAISTKLLSQLKSNATINLKVACCCLRQLHSSSVAAAASRETTPTTTSGNSTQKKLSFAGKTAIVTGAGRGLGRQYALLLASRGANVVVNDFGGSVNGNSADGDKNVAADLVVDEICSLNAGGKAIANYGSVSDERDVERLVKSAVDAFNRVDIVINNAGILRDKSFAKMSVDDFDAVLQVHLRGSFLVSKAVWPLMREQQFGRLVMTSSTSGLFGNFGQANYSAAKLGLAGLASTLAIEGAKASINVNTIVPLAASRMSHALFPPDFVEKLNPSFVAPLVCWLCHETCTSSGGIYEAAGGSFGRYSIAYCGGKFLPNASSSNADSESSIEVIADNWKQITNGGDKRIETFNEYLAHLMTEFEKTE